jgi:hypothetical protein
MDLDSRLIERKNDLINFLTTGIDEYHFTNGLEGRQLGFKSYNEFLDFQKRIVEQFNEGSISTIEMIRNELLPITKVIDRPTMNNYKATGFVFDAASNIVYYDSRR